MEVEAGQYFLVRDLTGKPVGKMLIVDKRPASNYPLIIVNGHLLLTYNQLDFETKMAAAMDLPIVEK